MNDINNLVIVLMMSQCVLQVAQIESKVQQISHTEQPSNQEPSKRSTFPQPKESKSSPSQHQSNTVTMTTSLSHDLSQNGDMDGKPEFVNLRLRKIKNTPWEQEQKEAERLSQSLPLTRSRDYEYKNQSFEQVKKQSTGSKQARGPEEASKSSERPSQLYNTTASVSVTSTVKSVPNNNNNMDARPAKTVKSQKSRELQGTMDENALPDSRVEWDGEDGQGLPSVKNLLSKFSEDNKHTSPEQQGDGVRRVSYVQRYFTMNKPSNMTM